MRGGGQWEVASWSTENGKKIFVGREWTGEGRVSGGKGQVRNESKSLGEDSSGENARYDGRSPSSRLKKRSSRGLTRTGDETIKASEVWKMY